MAMVRRRVTDDRISVSIPSYGFPHSIVDSTIKARKGQPIELVGDVRRLDGDTVTVNLASGVVTVAADKVRLLRAYVPPARKTPLVDRAD